MAIRLIQNQLLASTRTINLTFEVDEVDMVNDLVFRFTGPFVWFRIYAQGTSAPGYRQNHSVNMQVFPNEPVILRGNLGSPSDIAMRVEIVGTDQSWEVATGAQMRAIWGAFLTVNGTVKMVIKAAPPPPPVSMVASLNYLVKSPANQHGYYTLQVVSGLTQAQITSMSRQGYEITPTDQPSGSKQTLRVGGGQAPLKMRLRRTSAYGARVRRHRFNLGKRRSIQYKSERELQVHPFAEPYRKPTVRMHRPMLFMGRPLYNTRGLFSVPVSRAEMASMANEADSIRRSIQSIGASLINQVKSRPSLGPYIRDLDSAYKALGRIINTLASSAASGTLSSTKRANFMTAFDEYRQLVSEATAKLNNTPTTVPTITTPTTTNPQPQGPEPPGGGSGSGSGGGGDAAVIAQANDLINEANPVIGNLNNALGRLNFNNAEQSVIDKTTEHLGAVIGAANRLEIIVNTGKANTGELLSLQSIINAGDTYFRSAELADAIEEATEIPPGTGTQGGAGTLPGDENGDETPWWQGIADFFNNLGSGAAGLGTLGSNTGIIIAIVIVLIIVMVIKR